LSLLRCERFVSLPPSWRCDGSNLECPRAYVFGFFVRAMGPYDRSNLECPSAYAVGFFRASNRAQLLARKNSKAYALGHSRLGHTAPLLAQKIQKRTHSGIRGCCCHAAKLFAQKNPKAHAFGHTRFLGSYGPITRT